MEEKEQNKQKVFWDARIVVSFKRNRLKLNILIFEETKQEAERKAVEWAKKYVEDNDADISKLIGSVFMIAKPSVQVFKTSYSTVI